MSRPPAMPAGSADDRAAHHVAPALDAPPVVPRPFWHPGSLIALARGRPVIATILLLTVLFSLLTITVVRGDLLPTPWDVGITHEIQEIPFVPIGQILVWVSAPGFTPWNFIIPAVVVLFMLFQRWRLEAWFMALAAAGGVLAELVKVFIDRPRPTPEFANIYAELSSYSFPSGHVTGYTMLYGFIFYLAYTLLPRRSIARWTILVVCGALVALVGVSRVYMGQHWASDALAGYALGFAYLLLLIEVYRFVLQRREARREAAGDAA
jgi:membrane-associated phospholipid phosphatase